jgi:hypothetical protein
MRKKFWDEFSKKRACVLTFLSFEQRYEKIRIEIQIDKNIDKACGRNTY